ncbi:MAG: hypothetical protein EBR86_17835, partial [Planctomycetia bacterium]|nr:hypothetical protein [Planctomycetia bacterium]
MNTWVAMSEARQRNQQALLSAASAFRGDGMRKAWNGWLGLLHDREMMASAVNCMPCSCDGDQTGIDAAFFEASIKRAIAARNRFDIQSNGMRLIHGESDGLPGLIVDRYDDTLVAQFLSSGAERWKQEIANALQAQTRLTKLYERSDSGVRGLEGLQSASGWLRGEGSTGIELREHDWKLSLDIAEGHKTGFYLDQRDSRKKFADYTRRLQFQRVLNCYCYTGGFTVAALAGGAAHVT